MRVSWHVLRRTPAPSQICHQGCLPARARSSLHVATSPEPTLKNWTLLPRFPPANDGLRGKNLRLLCPSRPRTASWRPAPEPSPNTNKEPLTVVEGFSRRHYPVFCFSLSEAACEHFAFAEHGLLKHIEIGTWAEQVLMYLELTGDEARRHCSPQFSSMETTTVLAPTSPTSQQQHRPFSRKVHNATTKTEMT